MSDQRVPLKHLPVMTYEQMLEKVRYEGAYPTREKAEEAVRLVLAGLGRQLTGDERVELAARLPFEAARLLTAQIPDTQPLTGWAFVKDLAARTGAPVGPTRWDTGSVLTAVVALAGPDLLTRILRQLPSGYALLFGRAELTPAAQAATALVRKHAGEPQAMADALVTAVDEDETGYGPAATAAVLLSPQR